MATFFQNQTEVLLGGRVVVHCKATEPIMPGQVGGGWQECAVAVRMLYKGSAGSRKKSSGR